jgi:hypothetical protein
MYEQTVLQKDKRFKAQDSASRTTLFSISEERRDTRYEKIRRKANQISRKNINSIRACHCVSTLCLFSQ